MSDVASSWKEVLGDRIPALMGEEIDQFEALMQLRKQGKLEDKVFAELRLRRGSYGQRYDNGKRHDGVATREIPFPRRGLTKGPETEFDAPGMQRIKIPYGRVTADQLEVLADCAEEYSNAILHISTRQAIQLHFIDIEDTPDMHRRLASVGITTREACGNSVRNISGCPRAGICRDEKFDIAAYADAETWHLLGHRDVQDFGRKFKIAYSGCAHDACGRAMMHDLGFIAEVREVNGVEQRGFRVVVGGGLGPVPHVAKELYAFMPEDQMLPVSQAISRVYARLGEKRNRNKARIKFLVAQLGIEEFRRLVDAELMVLEPDPRWTDWLEKAHEPRTEALPAPVTDGETAPAPGFAEWVRTNVYEQRQEGFVSASINLPLGDITSRQTRMLADIVRRYTRGDSLRTTVEQNFFIRWVHQHDLVALYNDLYEAKLAGSGAGSITDVTTCPGTDTCKLGIASARGLGVELRDRLSERALQNDPLLGKLNVGVSGCPNSCGLHHISDIGFYGSSRNMGTYKVPHFQLMLGGSTGENAGNFSLALGAFPSKRAPQVVDRLLDLYTAEHEDDETFRGWVMRVGKKVVKEKIQDLVNVPSYEEDPSFYVDWHDSREYSIGDIGVGECAGEVVSLTQFSLAAAESMVFDASVLLDDTEEGFRAAAQTAYEAMITAAQGLLKVSDADVSNAPEVVFSRFKVEFLDSGRFFERYIGANESQYLLAAHQANGSARDRDEARRRVEEAQLFVEACYACYARLLQSQNTVTAIAGAVNS
ncbi:MAG: nitrite/sulfite reductase [Gemmatimonadota bacterium]|jgi:sulfite reductase (ferredoxin)|nr:nitrite/sulfite reductase [Gemmatimonadota bacterium]